MKQQQFQPKHRAPHGSPQYHARVGAWVTKEQYDWTRKNGGSAIIREAIQEKMDRVTNTK